MNKKVRSIISSLVVIIVILGGLLLFKDRKSREVNGNITLWANSINYDYLLRSSKSFMDTNPKAKIAVVNIESYEYEEKILEGLNSGILPNIIQADTDELLEIDEKYSDKVDINDEKSIVETYSNNFTNGRIAEATKNNKLLGIPFTSNPIVLYLRQDMMAEFGYKHEDINTWDELIKIGSDIYERSNGKIHVLNAVGKDYNYIISLLVMQAMEGASNEEEIQQEVIERINLLKEKNILNLKAGGSFLARISSIDGMRELKSLEVPCVWTANNAPAKKRGSNRFYIDEGNNLVVINNSDKNSELITRFIGFLATNTDEAVQYISEGEFFLSFLSTYKDKSIEWPVKNFKGKSPLVIMANITEKAPSIKDYDLYRKIKKELIIE